MILSQICNIYDGTHQTPKYVDEGVPFYSVEHVSKDDFSNTKFITEEVFAKECKRVSIEQGDILMTRIGSVGVPKFIDWSVRASFYVSLALLKPKIEEINMGWLSYYIQSPEIQRDIWRLTIHVAFPKKINLGDIGKIRVKLPSQAVQESNYVLFKSVDRKINLLTKKKEALETYKKGLMQKLFSQELRFKREDGTDYPEWKFVKFESILIPRSQRNKNCKYSEVYSVSNKEGFIPQTKQFDGYSVASNDVSNYKLVHPNDIVYNPSRINVGSIAINQTDGIKIVSPLYNIFSVDRGYNPSFWFMLKELHYFKHLVDISCSGSVRDSLSLDDLLSFKMNLPSTEEAKRIEAFLSVCDRKISTVTKQLSALNNLKKGLLQQMFV